MKANLYIKGLKDPIELEEEEAKVAQALIQDATKSTDTPFVIDGIWAGKKSDMKFVVFAKEDKRFYQNVTEPMGEHQAASFELEIVPDIKKSEEIFGIKSHWKLFYCERNGAIRVEILEIPDRGIKTYKVFVLDPALFVKLENQISSYDVYKGNKEFVEKKKIEELEKTAVEVAGEMKINTDE